MKSMVVAFFLLTLSNFTLSQTPAPKELSIIRSIDDYDLDRNYVEVSEEGLPSDHFLQLVQKIGAFRFTILSETKVRDLFEDLRNDSRARMKYPGGRCSSRRAYIQNLLRKKNIVSGKILLKCPKNNGRLRLQDQVSRRYYTFSNFHDTNVVAIKTNTGYDFRIMDLQFLDGPASLHEYLTKIEASQKIRPLKRRGTSSRMCYWTISTQSLTY